MQYKKADVKISVEHIDGFGKNPGLWIGTENPNQMVKVASFGSQDKADLFEKWLGYLLGIDDREVVKWDD